MAPFRALLLVIFATIAAYTAVVVSNHGLHLLPVFFGDIAKPCPSYCGGCIP